MPLTMQDLSGLFTALVTPFQADGSLDRAALTALVERQIAAGAAGVVPIGGTGEYPALSRAERAEVVRLCVEAAGGRPVIPGVLSTGFADAVEAGRDFAAAGAAAVMTVTPYYAAGPQEGMRRYFKEYRDAVGLPVLLYEIPRRTTVAMKAETIQAMAEDGSIIGMKYSSYDLPEFIRVIRLAGSKMAVLSGEEPLFATHMALGARGGVLATANVYPERWIEVLELAGKGGLRDALARQADLDELATAVFAEVNPGPLKRYMAMAGMPVGGVRLPLVEPSEATVAGLSAALAAMSAGARR
ncbi:4-hydroxy-tetrahydrodipicolinate synthase [Tistlia consotensis]|uniref:4-hydroxy-tetrahydrodipicolinate synthase n=1 Tax=Tistlia consotensis USBA 355 TaxID=560819 RepID=A0A1Y6B7R4_9PROT|nr:4-hydroxy-tetrahydrodipicolinate synthase [Tistlia consotensis]SME97450.1 4-hydroxy-tetrahydrodipicolinate synthase [Tistlia consotensis USBA 355]SNR56798.1 4-hydroxy-tetrahydrodipicolinate synthase [Tistlia consotensis]